MTLREKIEVMEAFERGEEIEGSWDTLGTDWAELRDPSWDFSSHCYRIKPKPKQTVTIEKWLCKSVYNDYYIVEGCLNHLRKYEGNKRKLLDTYEVEV